MRWIVHGTLFVALAVGIFSVLPRLGGLTREAAGLRHARVALLAAAVLAQAASLGCYALLYRQVLAALGARVRFRLVVDVVLASFFVSHLTPFGSAAGALGERGPGASWQLYVHRRQMLADSNSRGVS